MLPLGTRPGDEGRDGTEDSEGPRLLTWPDPMVGADVSCRPSVEEERAEVGVDTPLADLVAPQSIDSCT